jgi:hypothetical protein
MKTKSAAILTIHNAADMTPKGRKQIIAWLKNQIANVEQYHSQMSKRFTARYIYSAK